MRTFMVLVAVLGLAASPAFGQCGGGWGYSSGYSGCSSYYSGGCGSYYSDGCGSYSYPSCGTTYYRSSGCGVVYRSYSDGCCGQTTTTTQQATQKVEEKASPLPAAPPKSSPLPAIQEEPALPKPPKEEFDTSMFNIRVKQPNGEMVTVRVKNGFMPQIRTIDGKRWAVYDARIPFAKYRAAYERQGYIAYVHAPKPQLVAAR